VNGLIICVNCLISNSGIIGNVVYR